MQMTEWFPNSGSPHPSPHGWRPCLGTNHFLYWFPLLPCWSVQPEPFTSLLELISHESKCWHCHFPQTLEHISLSFLCFHCFGVLWILFTPSLVGETPLISPSRAQETNLMTQAVHFHSHFAYRYSSSKILTPLYVSGWSTCPSSEIS